MSSDSAIRRSGGTIPTREQRSIVAFQSIIRSRNSGLESKIPI